MTNEPATRAAAALPPVADQATYQAELDEIRIREVGRTPISQWPRLEAGHSDDLTAGS